MVDDPPQSLSFVQYQQTQEVLKWDFPVQNVHSFNILTKESIFKNSEEMRIEMTLLGSKKEKKQEDKAKRGD